MNSWIRGPGKDEQSNRNEPARNHHWNQALFSRRLSIVLSRHLEVVLVDKRCADSTHNDSNGKGNKHETSGPSTPSFTVLVHDGVAENIVRIRAQTIKVKPQKGATYATKNMYSKPYRIDM